ncbi:MAG: hypothetical protein AB1428_05660 [Bacteroidota bacterium]
MWGQIVHAGFTCTKSGEPHYYTKEGAMYIKMTALFLALLLAEPVSAQTILIQGEMEIDVVNPVTAKFITADASAASVAHDWCSWYPLTHDFDYRSQTTPTFFLQHTNRGGCPGATGASFFAYGAYKITIEGHIITVDYRDADYEDGNGQFGTGYNTADMKLWYNCADGWFYNNPDLLLAHRISGGVAMWEGGRKSPAYPRIPVTVTNSGLPGGVVIVDGGTYTAPFKPKWAVQSGMPNTHTIAAVTMQTINGLIYTFLSWSDGGSWSHQVTASLDKFSTVYTANSQLLKPVRVQNFWVSGLVGEHPHLTWDVHPNADVNYYVYRKIRHNGVVGSEVQIATLSHFIR